MEISPKNIEVEEWVKSGEEWRKLFTRTNSLDTNTYAIFVKSEECFWKRLTIILLLSAIYDDCLRHIWWTLTSYMILACVIYDTCLRHIWYLSASYMMQAHAILGVGWCPICLLQAPYMPISENIFPGVATLSGSGWFLCYHLGEKQLPSRRMGVAEATLSARGWMLSIW